MLAILMSEEYIDPEEQERLRLQPPQVADEIEYVPNITRLRAG